MKEQTKYNNIRRTYNQVRLERDNKVRRDNAKRSRDVSHDEFKNLCDSVNKLIEAECSVVSVERERLHLKQQFDEVKRYNSEFMLACDDGLDSAQNWLSALTKQYSTVNDAIDKYINVIKAPKRADLPKIHLEKIPLPKFDGDIRSYPRFRQDFTELIMPTLGDKFKEASFVLRQCLHKDIVRYFESCGDDANLLIRRLDEKYGDRVKSPT